MEGKSRSGGRPQKRRAQDLRVGRKRTVECMEERPKSTTGCSAREEEEDPKGMSFNEASCDATEQGRVLEVFNQIRESEKRHSPL